MSNGDLKSWNETVSDNILIRPPWDRMLGREACNKGLKVFFQNYKGSILIDIDIVIVIITKLVIRMLDTKATALRIILDKAQPHLGVVQQVYYRSLRLVKVII